MIEGKWVHWFVVEKKAMGRAHFMRKGAQHTVCGIHAQEYVGAPNDHPRCSNCRSSLNERKAA